MVGTRSGKVYRSTASYARRRSAGRVIAGQRRRMVILRGRARLARGLRYGGYGLAAYYGVGLARGAAWKLRTTARNRAWRSRRQNRGVRHTHNSIQEVHRFLNETSASWINHLKHPFGTFTTAPVFKPMKNNQGEKFDVRLDLTRHMFEDVGKIDTDACQVDISGIAIDIELVNPDILNDVYVRTAVTRLKNIGHDIDINDESVPGIDDEYFQDPHDKCKKWDFDAEMNQERYADDCKISMKLNRAKHSVYHDRVILLGRGDAAATGGLAPVVQRGYDKNRRKITIRWFPKGGYRMKILHDGDTKKSWMDTRLVFRMWAVRKKILGHHEQWTAEDMSYKIRVKTYFKKVN